MIGHVGLSRYLFQIPNDCCKEKPSSIKKEEFSQFLASRNNKNSPSVSFKFARHN